MSEQREMTLDEWCAQLPDFHLVNKELKALKESRTPDLADYAELQAEIESCDMALDAKITDCEKLKQHNKMLHEDNEKMFSLIMDLREQGAANFIRANGYTRIEMVLRDHQAALQEVDDGIAKQALEMNNED